MYCTPLNLIFSICVRKHFNAGDRSFDSCRHASILIKTWFVEMGRPLFLLILTTTSTSTSILNFDSTLNKTFSKKDDLLSFLGKPVVIFMSSSIINRNNRACRIHHTLRHMTALTLKIPWQNRAEEAIKLARKGSEPWTMMRPGARKSVIQIASQPVSVARERSSS